MKTKIGLIPTISFILFISFVSCNNRENTFNDFHQKKVDSIYYFQTRLDSIIIFAEIGDLKTLNKFIFMDLKGNRVGNSLEFYPDGNLKMRSNYVDGKQNGEEHIFDERGNLIWYYNYYNDEKHGTMYEYYSDGCIKQHKIFDNGDPLYSAFYESGIKKVEIIHPKIVSERIADGNYELTGYFKFPFLGNISGRIDSLPNAEFILKDKVNFQISIPDADELKDFRVDFTFKPAVLDTVQFSEYGYEHEVMIK